MKSSRCAAALLAASPFAFIATMALAQTTAPPSVEKFFEAPRMTSARMSPTGKYVGAIIKDAQGRSVLVVEDTKELKGASLVAGFSNADIASFSWINDNRLYFMTYDTSDPTKAYNGANGSTFAVDRDGKNMVQLTTPNWGFSQEKTGTHIVSKLLPAEYDLVGTVDDDSDDVIVAKYLFTSNDYSVDQVVLYRLDTRGRHLSRLLDTADSAPPMAITRWLLEADGTPRIAIHQKKGRYVFFYFNPDTRKWDKLGDFNELEGEGFRPAFISPDGSLFVTKGNGADGAAALYRYDLKQRKLPDEPLLKLDGFDFRGGAEADYKQRKLVGIHYYTDAAGTAWLNPKFKEYQKTVDAALPGATNFITCGRCLSSEALLVISESDRQPARYIVFNTVSGKLAQIGQTRPDIVPAQMGSRDFVRFAARDGMQIPMYVTTPPGKTSGPLPTVVLVHGGPNARGGYWEWDDEAQFLASRGYLVLQPEFRGSRGFGYKHYIAGRKQWGLAMQDDLADAAKWAIAKGMADPKRIGIAGASYGGYATLMGLINDPAIFRCGVDWLGVTDINLLFTSFRSDATNDDREYDMRYMIGDPDIDAAALKKASPVEQANRITQPLLLAYGGRDSRVPVVHQTAFRNAVSSANKNIEWVFYPEEGHGWFYDKDNYDFWTKVEKFLDVNLKSAH